MTPLSQLLATQSRYVETLGWTLLHSLWQLAAIAALTALTLAALRRASSNARYLVACAALALMPATLIVTYAQLLPPPPAIANPRLPSEAVSITDPAPLKSEILNLQFPAFSATPTPALTLPWRTRLEQALRPHLPTAVALYLLGTLFMALRLALSYARLQSLTARSTPLTGPIRDTLDHLAARMSLRRTIRLLTCEAIEVPTVLGALKPVILLPAAALVGLSTHQLEALLAHELAHIRRHDYLLNLLQSLLETALFYHPAVWWLSARIRHERELCCDDAVIALTGDPLTYARALASMETLRAAAAPALAARGGALLPRIRRLLNLTPPNRRTPHRFLTTTLAGLLVTFLAAALYIGCSRTETAPPPPATASTQASTAPATQTAPASRPAPASRAARQMIHPNLAIRDRLQENLKEITAENQSLEKVLNFLRDNMGANIFVDWATLKEVHIDRTTPVSVSLKDVPFRKALTTILSLVSTPTAQLSYIIDDGIIVISTKEDLSSSKYLVDKAYDIRDLLVPPPGNPKIREQMVTELMDTIKSTVAPDTWRDTGGKIGSIRELDGQLIVTQTSDNQLSVVQLLQLTRAARGLPNPSSTSTTRATTTSAPSTTRAGADTFDIPQAERTRILTLYSEAKRASDDALAKQQYQQAQAQAQQAIDLIAQNQTLFSYAEIGALRDGAQRQLVNVNSRWDAYKSEQGQILANKTRADELRRQQTASEVRKQKVEALVAEARRLYAQAPDTTPPDSISPLAMTNRRQLASQLLAEARRSYDGAQFRDALELLQLAGNLDPQNDTLVAMLRLVQQKLNVATQTGPATAPRVMRQSIDTAEHLIPYADLMVYPDNWPEITRKRGGGESAQDSPENRAARDKLEEELKELTADKQGLEKVLNFLRDNMGANIFVNWAALQQGQIERTTPVTVSLKEVPFRKALVTVLSLVSTPTAQLSYVVEDGIITISTREDLAARNPPIVKTYDVRDLLELRDTADAATGGSATNPALPPDIRRHAQIVWLTDSIKSTVAPDTWRDSGGTVGDIRELNGQLIVNQTIENQIATHTLLQQLREPRNIQIAVEARMYLLDDDTYKALALTKPQNAPRPATAPGTLPSGEYLSNIIPEKQLDALLKKLQDSPNTSMLTAPRVTLFNGQRGLITCATQQKYIAGWSNQKDADGTDALVPDMRTLVSGVTLNVTATVSADRKNAILDLGPSLRKLDKMQFVPPEASRGSPAPGSFIQKPAMHEAEIHGMISVPDQQVLLLGGTKFTGEFPVDPQHMDGWQVAPAVRNATARNLVIMIRPEIIIHKVIENDPFGPGYDQPSGSPAGATQPATTRL